MKRANTPTDSSNVSQKKSKQTAEDDEDEEEFEPIDEGNGWTQQTKSSWINTYTGEEIEFKPIHPAGKVLGTSLDIINSVVAVPHHEVVGTHGMMEQNVAAAAAAGTTWTPAPNGTQMPHPQQQQQTQQQQQIQQQNEQQIQQLQHLEARKNAIEHVFSFTRHLVNNNRANLLRACVHRLADHFVAYNGALVDEMFVACHLIDENFINNYVDQLSSTINSKGDAEQPVDLLDSNVDSSDDENVYEDDDEEEGNEEEEEDSLALHHKTEQLLHGGKESDEENGEEEEVNISQKVGGGSQCEPVVLSDDDNEESDDNGAEEAEKDAVDAIQDSSSVGLNV